MIAVWKNKRDKEIMSLFRLASWLSFLLLCLKTYLFKYSLILMIALPRKTIEKLGLIGKSGQPSGDSLVLTCDHWCKSG